MHGFHILPVDERSGHKVRAVLALVRREKARAALSFHMRDERGCVTRETAGSHNENFTRTWFVFCACRDSLWQPGCGCLRSFSTLIYWIE